MRDKQATSSRRRRTTGDSGDINNPTHIVDASPGGLAMSPLRVVIMLGVSLVFFAGVTVFQTMGTEQAVFSNLLHDIQLTPAMIIDQAHRFFQGKLDFYEGVAFACSFGVQFVLLTVAFPAAAAHAILHHHYNVVTTSEMSEGASTIKQWQVAITKVIVGAELVTDVLYVTQHNTIVASGHQVFSFFFWFIPWPNLDGPNAGILLIGILYGCLLCFTNIISVRMVVTHLEILFLKIRGRI